MRPISAFILPFTFIQIAGAEPRINQISPHPSLDASTFRFIDIDGNGFQDIVTEILPYSSNETPLLIRNVGGRMFSAPEQTFYQQTTNDARDSESTLIELDGAGDYHNFISKFRTVEVPGQSSSLIFTPLVIDIEQTGTFGTRIAIAPESSDAWIPVELDANHRSEFIHTRRISSDESDLTIMDRQSDGSYTPTVIRLAGDVSVRKATAIDLDYDGDLDLVLHDGNEHRLLRRSGPRSFGEPSAAFQIYGLTITDLDGDGLPDFHSNGADSFTWRLNFGNFQFSEIAQRDLLATSDDFKLVHAKAEPGEAALLHFAKSIQNAISLKAVRFGDWTIVSEDEIATTPLNPLPRSSDENTCIPLAIRDLDEDGHPDFAFIATNRLQGEGYSSVRRLAVAWGTADGFSPPVYTHPAPISSEKMIVADFDEQSAPDIITGPDTLGGFWFFGNDGTGAFSEPLRISALDVPAGSPPGTSVSSFHHGDLNDDGIQDLVIDYSRRYSSYYQTACGIAFGKGDGTFHPPVLPPGSFDNLVSCPCGLDYLIDWDGDGDLDAIADGHWRENIGGQFALETIPLIDGASLTDILGNPINKTYSRVGDVDGDGRQDIISLVYRIEEDPSPFPIVGLLNIGKGFIGIGFSDASGGIEEIAEIPVTLFSSDLLGNPIVHDLRVADVNGDGRPDLCYTQNSGTDLLGNPLTTTKWRRNPGGAAARNPANWITLPYGSHHLPDSVNPQDDFDGDGRKDWATSSGYVRPTPAGPAVSASYDFTGGVNFHSSDTEKYVADFDGDGDADTLHTDRQSNFSLVRNTIIDERSAITRHLVAAGLPGHSAQPFWDADGDGRDNETELLLGTDPLTADSPPANPLAVNLTPDQNGRALNFRLPSYASELGLHYDVEHSTNLTEWAPLDGVAPGLISNTAGWNYMNLPIDCSGPCGYFRVKGRHRTE